MMIRVLPATLVIPWRALFIASWVVLNAAMLLHPGVLYLGSLNHDWHVWLDVPQWLAAGRLYEGFYWSPIAAALLVYVFVPLGYSWWLGLHLAAVPLLLDWWLVGLTVVSVPFWVDTLNGNTVVFVYVAGAMALQGSRAGALSSLALFVLMPRPLVAPLAIYLLWKQPSNRLPFALMVAVTLGVTLALGYLDDWLSVLLALSGSNNDHFANLGPTHWLGSAWLILGVPLAAWLTTKGRVGLAGLAMSPYVLPMYPLVILWDYVSLFGSRRAPAAMPLVANGPARHSLIHGTGASDTPIGVVTRR